jgi:hypothetical protein
MTSCRQAVALVILVQLCAVGTAGSTEVGYSRKYGVGFVLGDPTGLSGKVWIGPTNAIDLGVGFYGYGFRRHCPRGRDGLPVCGRHWGRSTISLNVDYLWESKLFERSAAQLDWHVGAGARAFFLGDPCAFDCWAIGARAPLGLDVTFTRPSFLEVFLELAPVFYVAPSPFLALEAGLGVRGYF